MSQTRQVDRPSATARIFKVTGISMMPSPPTLTAGENKKLSYRRGTARRNVTVKTVLNVAQMFVELHLISPTLGE